MNGGVGAASGEVLTAPPSFAVLRLDVEILWRDFEDALERHELEAATESVFLWFEALQALRDAS